MRAASYFQSLGRSWPREIRPFPIAPMLIRLDGANAPKTDAGTIDGKPDTTDAAAKVLPAVNQIELTPFLQRAPTVALCRELGITLEAYSPLTRGQRLSHPVVLELAQAVARTPAQVLLRWGIQKGFVILPKSVQPARIAENAALFDFELDAAAMQRLDALEEGLVTGWNPETQS